MEEKNKKEDQKVRKCSNKAHVNGGMQKNLKKQTRKTNPENYQNISQSQRHDFPT